MNDPLAHGKILSIIGYLRNANETTMSYHFIPTRTALTKKYKITRASEGAPKPEPSNTAGGRSNRADTSERVWEFLKKLNQTQ